ncbi:MAG TPA: DUF1499 domain-containing protein [Rhizomicrobium sp.]|jgi:hypothetical protein|nr:DUF1499 domain-containing protein [Rhizomicrobium sp.]
MRTQTIAARLSLAAFIAALLICLTAAFGTRFGYWPFATGLRILKPGVAVGAAAAVAGAVWLALALRNNDSRGWRRGFAGLIGAIVLLYFPVSAEMRAWKAPPIHDISTDVEYAPPFKALLPLRKGATNGPEYDGPRKVVLKGRITTVAELQKLSYPDIKPVAKLLNPRGDPKIHPQSVLFWRAFERAKSMGWNIVAFDPKAGTIEATDTTLWFGFTDDIAIRVLPAGTLGAKLDIRSKSREGAFDYGRNAERIEDYIKGL